MAGEELNYYAQKYPSYKEFVTDVSTALSSNWNKLETYDLTPSGWWSVLRQHGSCTVNDIVGIIAAAYLWTIARELLTKNVFKPLANAAGLAKKEQEKAPECMWKLTVSTIAWLYSAFLVLYQYDVFYHPSLAIKDWNLKCTVPWDLYIAYAAQLSFYVHSIYATAILDEWRKDSVVLLVHHVFTILLLSSSYLFRYTHLGALVLFFHDFSDIFLELTKLTVYLKTKGGVWETRCETLSTAGFIAFGISWFVFRLYWFPLKAIYVGAYVSYLRETEVPPFYFFTNGLMLALLAIHIWWFKFIVLMAYKVSFGKNKEVKDPREYQKNGVTRNGLQKRKHA